MIKVKEYAEKHNISIQAVHQALNRKKNKERLAGHIHLIDGVKHLDDEAVAILDEVRSLQPVVILQDERAELKQENESLKNRLKAAQDMILVLQSNLIDAKKETLLLQDSVSERVKEAEDKVTLELEQKFQEKMRTAEQLHQEELVAERSRKLTWRERMLGRKEKINDGNI